MGGLDGVLGDVLEDRIEGVCAGVLEYGRE